MGPLLTGTIIWLVIAIIGGWKVLQAVSAGSPDNKREANLKVAKISIVMVAIQLWMMWITCYMHQQYPLVKPVMEF